MKIIGLIGGISWVSTIEYYRLINEGINKKTEGKDFSNCIIYSFNYSEIKKNNEAGDWDKTLEMLSSAAIHLKNSGAEGIILCAATMHMLADKIGQRTGLPLIHIATATAREIKKRNLKKVALLGTKFTMENDFFKNKLAAENIETIIPDEKDRIFIHHTISEELGNGIFKDETRQQYLKIIAKLVERGCEGAILGCTEIPLLVKQSDLLTPVFNTTEIHANAAVDFSLG